MAHEVPSSQCQAIITRGQIIKQQPVNVSIFRRSSSFLFFRGRKKNQANSDGGIGKNLAGDLGLKRGPEDEHR